MLCSSLVFRVFIYIYQNLQPEASKKQKKKKTKKLKIKKLKKTQINTLKRQGKVKI